MRGCRVAIQRTQTSRYMKRKEKNLGHSQECNHAINVPGQNITKIAENQLTLSESSVAACVAPQWCVLDRHENLSPPSQDRISRNPSGATEMGCPLHKTQAAILWQSLCQTKKHPMYVLHSQ